MCQPGSIIFALIPILIGPLMILKGDAIAKWWSTRRGYISFIPATWLPLYFKAAGAIFLVFGIIDLVRAILSSAERCV